MGQVLLTEQWIFKGSSMLIVCDIEKRQTLKAPKLKITDSEYLSFKNQVIEERGAYSRPGNLWESLRKWHLNRGEDCFLPRLGKGRNDSSQKREQPMQEPRDSSDHAMEEVKEYQYGRRQEQQEMRLKRWGWGDCGGQITSLTAQYKGFRF